MQLKNGKVLKLEDGVGGEPKYPKMYHLSIHAACDRWLAKRGMAKQSAARRIAWLYGGKIKSAA
jgi:hypothetical protein